MHKTSEIYKSIMSIQEQATNRHHNIIYAYIPHHAVGGAVPFKAACFCFIFAETQFVETGRCAEDEPGKT